MRRVVAFLAAFAALFGIAAAAVLGGSGSDPMISLSYLRDVFWPSLTAEIESEAAVGLGAVYETAAAQLEREAEVRIAAISGRESGMTTAARFTPVPVKAGDLLELQSGAGLLPVSGAVHLSAGTLIDLTGGVICETGAELVRGHRYLSAGPGRARVMVVSGLGGLSVQGNYALHPSAASGLPFSDVKAGDWFHPAVQYAYDAALMGGVGDGIFAPAGSMTRAMLATVLHRMEGTPAPAATGQFHDVAGEMWYSAAVDWAAESGIVNGLGGGLFGPGSNITREQLAVMLHRYAGFLALTTDSGGATLSGFPDGGAASEWARDALEWAVGTGILTGRSDGSMDPGGTATRAEVAVMLQRFAVWADANS